MLASRFLAVGPSALLLALGTSASAAIYTDATGENHDGTGQRDITSVEVTNDATTLSITMNVGASFAAPDDWPKFMVALDSLAGGNGTGNAWGRAITMPGTDFWIGTWVNGGGGALLYQDNGAGGWNEITAPGFSIGATSQSVTWTVPLATLGLSDGSTLTFDVYSGHDSGGANDALSLASQTAAGWDDPYDSGSNVSTYTVVVPEPASLALLAVGGLLIAGRRGMA